MLLFPRWSFECKWEEGGGRHCESEVLIKTDVVSLILWLPAGDTGKGRCCSHQVRQEKESDGELFAPEHSHVLPETRA